VRNPDGGGPAGVAARGELVEKRAYVVGAIRCLEAARSAAVTGRARARVMSGLMEAMLWDWGGCVVVASKGSIEVLRFGNDNDADVIGRNAVENNF
jgi:hypothetical protein